MKKTIVRRRKDESWLDWTLRRYASHGYVPGSMWRVKREYDMECFRSPAAAADPLIPSASGGCARREGLVIVGPSNVIKFVDITVLNAREIWGRPGAGEAVPVITFQVGDDILYTGYDFDLNTRPV